MDVLLRRPAQQEETGKKKKKKLAVPSISRGSPSVGLLHASMRLEQLLAALWAHTD